jgi:hypothetical protein
MAKKAAKKKVAKTKSSLIASKIAKVNKELEKAKYKAISTHRKLFFEAVEELFNEYERLEKFSWDQYAPHWNDGDECVFSCYFDSLIINDETKDEFDDLYFLGHLNELLSDREKEEKRIRKELEASKDKWEIDRLNRDLENMEKYDPKAIAEKHHMKKSIHELLQAIDESFYQDEFGEGTVIVSRDGISTEHCEHD